MWWIIKIVANMKKILILTLLLNTLNGFSQIQKPVLDIDLNIVRQKLQGAALQKNFGEAKAQALASGIKINLPAPDGNLIAFSPLESPLMSEELGKKFPDIKTYRLFGQNSSGVLTIYPEGMHAFIFTDKGNILISPVDKTGQKFYVFYQNNEELKELCEIGDEQIKKNGLVKGQNAPKIFSSGSSLRTYKLSIVTTGEFFTNNGSTQPLAQAAVVSMVNSLRGVYEKEVSNTFSLVSTKIYENPATDPFNPSSTSKALDAAYAFGALATSEPANFGLSVYDIGHVIHHSPGGGGVAYLNSPCANFNLATAASPIKAGAWSGGTTTSLATFIHEVGHQFSAGHTFNSVNSGCNGNIMTGSAFEPGSGSTYMSYWGSCSPDNVSGVVNRTYFHTNSLESIVNFSVNSGNCSSNTATGNSIPVIATNPNGRTLIIPKGTPFQLEGSGTDADNDVVLFNWEQYNLGNTRGGADDCQNTSDSPVFRSFLPSATGNNRFFPSLNSILTGSQATNDEALPQVPRTIAMRLTGRDGRNGGGGSVNEALTLTVDNSGPFLISSQNTNTFWLQGSSKIINWTVNGTNAAPINCNTVDILFSNDNGITFPTVLVSNTPNDGTHVVTVPTGITSTGRIKIMPSNPNLIFFDINNSPISIVASIPACVAETSNLTPTNTITALAGDAALNFNLYSHVAATTASRTTSTSDPTMPLIGYNLTGCTIPYTNTTYYQTYTFQVSASGSYTFTIGPGYNNGININLFAGSFSGGCTNWMGGTLNMSSGVTASNTLTVNLSPTINYVMTMAYQWNTSSTGTVNLNFSGAGSILQPVPAGNSYYAYNYVIVNTATNEVMAIQATTDLRNSTNFPAGNYAVYGISFLTDNTNFTSYINQPLANLQAAIVNASICAKLSNNVVPVVITNNCQNTLTLTGLATQGSQGANATITSTQVINTGTNVNYRAGNAIILTPQSGSGFTAASGSVFKAEIGGCN